MLDGIFLIGIEIGFSRACNYYLYPFSNESKPVRGELVEPWTGSRVKYLVRSILRQAQGERTVLYRSL
jgi:hypothetical protein